MAKNTIALIPEYRECDLCRRGDAYYDASMPSGGWANLCSSCFRSSGCSLGLGKGQRLMTADDFLDYAWDKDKELYNKYWKKEINTEELASLLHRIMRQQGKV